MPLRRQLAANVWGKGFGSRPAGRDQAHRQAQATTDPGYVCPAVALGNASGSTCTAGWREQRRRSLYRGRRSMIDIGTNRPRFVGSLQSLGADASVADVLSERVALSCASANTAASARLVAHRATKHYRLAAHNRVEERACKPDSVPSLGGWVAVIPLGRLLPTVSSDAPEGSRGPRSLSLVLLRVGFAEHPCYHECWCLWTPFSPTPATCRPTFFCGTFPRSLEAAVSGHLALRSPDFPPGFSPRATAQPSPRFVCLARTRRLHHHGLRENTGCGGSWDTTESRRPVATR